MSQGKNEALVGTPPGGAGGSLGQGRHRRPGVSTLELDETQEGAGGEAAVRVAGLQLGQGRRCERLGPGEIRRSLLGAPGRGERAGPGQPDHRVVGPGIDRGLELGLALFRLADPVIADGAVESQQRVRRRRFPGDEVVRCSRKQRASRRPAQSGSPPGPPAASWVRTWVVR